MANLMLTHRAHNAVGGDQYGPGGGKCPCCGPALNSARKERRRVRRAERRDFNRDLARGEHD